MILKIEEAFLSLLPEKENVFKQLMAVSGKVYRQLDGRETLRFVLQDKAFFIKKHFGVGWHEIFKNLFQGRLPVVSAKNEWLALTKLTKHRINVPKVLAFGEHGKNPANKRSFIVMEEIANAISLEDLCRDWPKKSPNLELKHRLIQQVAYMVSRMHGLGINHRDCYICHFLLLKASIPKSQPQLVLIDLHRAQLRKEVPERWLVKDLAGVYFSSMAIGLTQRDVLRFLEVYFSLPWRKVIKKHKNLLKAIEVRAHDLYQKEYSTNSPMPRYLG